MEAQGEDGHLQTKDRGLQYTLHRPQNQPCQHFALLISDTVRKFISVASTAQPAVLCYSSKCIPQTLVSLWLRNSF